jgi:hypothetical protein
MSGAEYVSSVERSLPSGNPNVVEAGISAFATSMVILNRWSRQRQALAEFMTTAQGSRLATSVGGVLTGRGGDFIIIDDPLKPEEAVSETQRTQSTSGINTPCTVALILRFRVNINRSQLRLAAAWSSSPGSRRIRLETSQRDLT